MPFLWIVFLPRVFFLALGLGLFLAAAGCSKGQVKSLEAERDIQKIEVLLAGLQEVYAKKDLVTLRSYFSSNFQITHPELFSAVRRTFEETEQVRMDLTLDVIHKDGENIKVLLHWDVNTTTLKSTRHHRGNTTLQLLEKETLQIVGLQGDNPFTLGVRTE